METCRESLHDMDEQELGALIEILSETVERLAHEKPSSGEYNHEVGVLRDVRQLPCRRSERRRPSSEV